MPHSTLAALLLVSLGSTILLGADYSTDEYKRLAGEFEAHLQKHILKPWFPRAVDKERGGFIQDYAEDWSEKRDGNKTLVYQARLTWMAAQVAISFPELAKEYAEYSNHGLDFLADKMWDKENGGFLWSVTADGKPTGERNNEKHVYGISFAMYAAATNYKATKNPKAIELAKQTFEWLEKHSYDGDTAGYTEALSVKGNKDFPYGTNNPKPPTFDLIGTAYGYKSMNTHIHLLESFTAYYEASPAAIAKSRLRALYNVVHDKICVVGALGEGAAMHLFFHSNWTPVPDADSFGHDLETAYLLMEAADTLSIKKDPWNTANELVDHALSFGWDEKIGGFYNEGSMFRKAHDKEKIWWVQAEGLNALLLMYEHEQRISARDKYWKAFLKQWDFIQKYQIDAKNNGWISMVSEDGHAKPGPKSDQWKDPYHQGRAVINVIERLKKLAEK
ncbi:MAG TPA: AGE family epimerase/isomerase [Planctomycetota bacterium]|nr:AGE family epimerase/isomerase [Planctomycetota bacterium]